MVVEEEKKRFYNYLFTYGIIKNSCEKKGIRKLEQVLYEKKRSRNNCGHSLGHGHTQGNRANRTGFYSSINKEQVISYSLRGCGRECNSRQNREKDIINTKFKHTLFKKRKKKKKDSCTYKRRSSTKYVEGNTNNVKNEYQEEPTLLLTCVTKNKEKNT